jgi:MutS domain III
MRINLSPNDGTLFLDVATIEAVELIRSSRVARDGNAAGSFAKNDSLLAVIDKTKTRPGKRFLRRTLLEPPGDIGTILARQDVVEELSGNEEGYFAICRALSSFPDLESVLASLLAKEAALVAQFSRAVPPASIEQQQERDSSVPSQQIGAAGPSRTPLKSRLNTAGCSASAAAVYFQQQPFQEITGRFASVSASDARRTDQKWTAGATLACGIATTMSLPSINIIRNVLKVKAAMDALGPILQVIEAGSSAILLAIAGSLQSTALVDLSNEIVTVLDESAAPSSRTEHMRLQGAFAVRNGRNGHLDVARKTLSENIEDMHELVRFKFRL